MKTKKYLSSSWPQTDSTLSFTIYKAWLLYNYSKHSINKEFVRWQFITVDRHMVFCNVCFPCPEPDCISFFIWHTCGHRFWKDILVLKWFLVVFVYFASASTFECVISHSHLSNGFAPSFGQFWIDDYIQEHWAVFAFSCIIPFLSSIHNSLCHDEW